VRANPCKVNYGTGNGTSILSTAQFAAAEKLEMTHVPYKGDAPASADLIAGRIQVMIATLSAGVLPQIKEGRLRVLATLLPNRSPLVPDAPTAAEAGMRGRRSPHGAACRSTWVPNKVVDRGARIWWLRPVAMSRGARPHCIRTAGLDTPRDGRAAQQPQVWRSSVQELGIERG
jgi:hypothetical protein